MKDRQPSTRLQQSVGVLVAVMAGVIAVTPLALAIALRGRSESMQNGLLVAASLLWMIAFAVYRGLFAAHERWRRRVLRREIVAARHARIDASELFQDHLNEQSAILDRIRDISDRILEEGILDPSRTLAQVSLINSHAFEAQGLVEDAIAEVRVETGSATFNFEDLDVRDEIEEITAPFIRAGHAITTDGPQYFAETDAAVFRLVMRGLVSSAIEARAKCIELSLARDGTSVVCTVADDGHDRANQGLAALSPVLKSLTHAVGGDLVYNRLLGRTQYSLILPEAIPKKPGFTPDPIDVLGASSGYRTAETAPSKPPPTRTLVDELVGFDDTNERGRTETVAARRRSQAGAR